jgi:putative flavoprotein involved in K+ transport
VIALKQDSSSASLLVETSEQTIEAAHVVIATGPFQRSRIPHWSREIPSRIFQVHANKYQGPEQLPRGAVLVVGSGASGCQIAEELYQEGRTVYLSVSRHRRAPRRYRGRDFTWWALERGIMDLRIDSFPGRKYPPSVVITGVNGGHDINIRQFAADGVMVFGRLLGIAGGAFAFDGSAEAILAASDAAYLDFRKASDEYLRTKAIDLPEEPEADLFSQPIPTVPALQAAEISTVIWSTGYSFDFGWVKLPILDEIGAPIQQRVVTSVPNAYFLGLHWMHTFKSGVLFGVGEDAQYLADRIAGGR